MPGFIIPFLSLLNRNKGLAALIGVMALVILIGGSYFLGSHNGEKRANAQAALTMERAINVALQRNTAALEKASAQRRLDDAAIAARTKGLSDVVAHEPDGTPTRRSVMLTCERLRLERNPAYASLPECAGLNRPAQAVH